jgi:hypothetical protein
MMSTRAVSELKRRNFDRAFLVDYWEIECCVIELLR